HRRLAGAWYLDVERWVTLAAIFLEQRLPGGTLFWIDLNLLHTGQYIPYLTMAQVTLVELTAPGAPIRMEIHHHGFHGAFGGGEHLGMAARAVVPVGPGRGMAKGRAGQGYGQDEERVPTVD